MTQTQNSTLTTKGQHLTWEERQKIEAYKALATPLSNRKIARLLGRAPQTIHTEIKDGTVRQLRRQKTPGKVYDYVSFIYSAHAGQAAYEKARQRSKRAAIRELAPNFMAYADKMMKKHHWSPDAIVGEAKKSTHFGEEHIPSTSTLYRYIDAGVLATRNIDLTSKVRRKTRPRKVAKNRRTFGQSIDNRPEIVATRDRFGDWEIDTVIGLKDRFKSCLLTLVERKTRYTLIIKLSGKRVEAVNDAIQTLIAPSKAFFSQLFKTITSDNGSEFAGLADQLKGISSVYYTHPYASYERGTNENHNGIIRRFIPKGTDIDTIDTQELLRIQQWMNHLPRKILGYATPSECLTKELELVGLA